MRLSSSAAGAAAVVIAALAFALPDDSRQEISIEADESSYDYAAEVSVLSGNVRVEQGTLLIEADRVTAKSSDGRVERIVAEGRPAHFRQQVEPDQDYVDARADRIEYVVREERLELRGNALLSQDNREYAGEVINWYMQEGRAHALQVRMKWQPEPRD